jgi:superfamily II DNA/RNA helicase
MTPTAALTPPAGNDHSRDREQEAAPANEDQMEWSAAELTDLDTSTIDHEGGFSALGVPGQDRRGPGGHRHRRPLPDPDRRDPRRHRRARRAGPGLHRLGQDPGLRRPGAQPARRAERPDRRPRALILSPTRELAMQIADVLSPLASAMDMSTILIAGGMGYGPQTRAFRKGVDLVVATPGRLVDLLETGDADLSGIEVVVLDEADHMADLGFMPAVSAILDAVPENGQRLLFSATLDEAVNKLVKKYLHDPVTHEIDPEKGSVSTAVHYGFQIKPHEKVQVMCEIANRPGHTIVFARTQRGASRMAEQMRDAGVMAGALHGGLTQGARARVLKAFKDGKLPVLVATDVAARGIDVDDVSLVLQVDPPMNSKDYLHRAGRTARAGQDGVVISMVLPHQRREVSRTVPRRRHQADRGRGAAGRGEPRRDREAASRSAASRSPRRTSTPWWPRLVSSAAAGTARTPTAATGVDAVTAAIATGAAAARAGAAGAVMTTTAARAGTATPRCRIASAATAVPVLRPGEQSLCSRR